MSTLSALSSTVKPRHVYQTDIAAMLLALCAIREADEALTQYIEDVVRNHVQQLVLQARAQALRRNAKAIAVEDLIFLVRHDRARLNRLRTYLSWKDVRKKMRELDQAGVGSTGAATASGGGGGGGEDDQIDAIEEPVSDKSLKVIKTTVRIPWELNDAWADYLHGVDDDPEDDEAEAYEVNKQRLREADLLTSRMSREEYEQYSQARQASFVFRKNKKFRDFIALPAILDIVAPQDEVLDVLGFLAYECVRALCDAGVAHKKSVTEAKRLVAEMEKRKEVREGKKRKREEEAIEGASAGEGNMEVEGATKADPSTPAAASNSSPAAAASGEGRTPKKEKGASTTSTTASTTTTTSNNDKQGPSASSPKRKPLEIPTSLFSAPVPDAAASVPAFGAAAAALADPNGGGPGAGAPAGAHELVPRVLFELEDVELGLHAVEHTYGSLKTSGMRNWRGGISRIPTRLV
ncbi:hypothetical protein JCM10908_004192 [Rhodotorula pacifica]|uniref:transcriptional regulator SPT3 n=1 Tax=Rhodotorula pacifica TaxID=1495444 RepID=UPI00317FF2BD